MTELDYDTNFVLLAYLAQCSTQSLNNIDTSLMPLISKEITNSSIEEKA